jgi:hypothetical protein
MDRYSTTSHSTAAPVVCVLDSFLWLLNHCMDMGPLWAIRHPHHVPFDLEPRSTRTLQWQFASSTTETRRSILIAELQSGTGHLGRGTVSNAIHHSLSHNCLRYRLQDHRVLINQFHGYTTCETAKLVHAFAINISILVNYTL